MSPPIALKPDVAVGADEKKRVGDMRQLLGKRSCSWRIYSKSDIVVTCIAPIAFACRSNSVVIFAL